MTTRARPLSPHLQIYRLPLVAILSITHRATGIALSAGAVFLVYWLAAVAASAQAYSEAQALCGAWYGRLGLLFFTFALYFHLCNGIRHLVWDAGWGFELKTVDGSGVAVLLATALLTLATWIIALS